MDGLLAVKFCWLIPLLPLVGAAIAGFFGARWLKQQSHWPVWIGVAASAVLSFMLLAGALRQMPKGPMKDSSTTEGGISGGAPYGWKDIEKTSADRVMYTWIKAGKFKADVGFFIDPLSVLMLCVVTGVGLLITIFAKGYMAGEDGYFRFFAYLGLFIFAMTILVMADNFVLLYLGWEGVGLCSYLLIGYYYQRPAAREAAKKAFLVNRIGDFGFGLGIMLIFAIFGTVSYFGSPDQQGVLLRAATPKLLNAWQQSALGWVPFLLMLGAFGKSAQVPLYVWLPDAMEGPTPVSALIHAATMVTAGVYMIARCGTLFLGNPAAMSAVAAIGTFTALFAAVIALRQFDLKKVFAYSTISQLGYMFAALGVLAPVAGMFHLMTHAFFKALLFLASGVVMHAMSGELDMRKMSGLKRVLPWTNIVMLVGCLALAGFPLFSGFFSKDEIIAAAWYHSKLIAILLLLAAFLTAYYTFRLYFRVFQGPLLLPATPPKAPAHGRGPADQEAHAGDSDKHLEHNSHAHKGHSHEPWIMIAPLVLLALGAIFVGYLNWPERHASLGGFLHESPSLILRTTWPCGNTATSASCPPSSVPRKTPIRSCGRGWTSST